MKMKHKEKNPESKGKEDNFEEINKDIDKVMHGGGNMKYVEARIKAEVIKSMSKK